MKIKRLKISHAIASAWLLLWYLAAFFALHASSQFALANNSKGPTFSHPLGFDAFGRDLLITVLRGSLTSSAFAALTIALAFCGATGLGSFTAIAPKQMRYLILRTLEFLLSFPTLLFALAWAAILGPGWSTLLIALLLGIGPGLTRLACARSEEILNEDYVLASLGLGASGFKIMRQHILPAVSKLCAVKLPALFAHALMAEATLSFLGLGAPMGHDTWGSILAQGKDYLIESPHLAIGSGLPLVLTTLCLQSLSERVSAHRRNQLR